MIDIISSRVPVYPPRPNTIGTLNPVNGNNSYPNTNPEFNLINKAILLIITERISHIPKTT